MDKQTIKWEDFKMSVELHKFYLELITKFTFYYYAITGAILSFYFAKDSPSISWCGLLLPIVLSFSLGGLLLYGSKLAWNLKRNIKRRAIGLDLEAFPNGIVLFLLSFIFGLSMLGVGITLIIFLTK